MSAPPRYWREPAAFRCVGGPGRGDPTAYAFWARRYRGVVGCLHAWLRLRGRSPDRGTRSWGGDNVCVPRCRGLPSRLAAPRWPFARPRYTVLGRRQRVCTAVSGGAFTLRCASVAVRPSAVLARTGGPVAGVRGAPRGCGSARIIHCGIDNHHFVIELSCRLQRMKWGASSQYGCLAVEMFNRAGMRIVGLSTSIWAIVQVVSTTRPRRVKVVCNSWVTTGVHRSKC